jgi:DNA-binding NtrC family response regulator
VLVSYDWPGNVRELEHVIETAILDSTGDTVDAHHLVFGGAPESPPTPAGEDLELPFRLARQRALASFERLYLLAQLRRYRGSIRNLAQHAGITSKHVRALLKRHGINRRDFRPPLRRRQASVLAGSQRGRSV